MSKSQKPIFILFKPGCNIFIQYLAEFYIKTNGENITTNLQTHRIYYDYLKSFLENLLKDNYLYEQQQFELEVEFGYEFF